MYLILQTSRCHFLVCYSDPSCNFKFLGPLWFVCLTGSRLTVLKAITTYVRKVSKLCGCGTRSARLHYFYQWHIIQIAILDNLRKKIQKIKILNFHLSRQVPQTLQSNDITCMKRIPIEAAVRDWTVLMHILCVDKCAYL
jgi:hypothetical protein